MEKRNNEILDLHFDEGNDDMDISGSGVYIESVEKIAEEIAAVKDTVKVINLKGQEGLTEIPKVLGECLLLEELDLSFTNLTEIPDFVFLLPALRSLSFYGCLKLSKFPEALYKAKNLENLEMYLDEGQFLSEKICSLSELRALKIYAEYCIKLPKKLGSLLKLEEFTLSARGNKDIGKKEKIVLPDSFLEHPSLKTISLTSNNFFTENPLILDLEHTVSILSTCPALEALKLSGFIIGDGHKHLTQLGGLKEIQLRHLLIDGNPFHSMAGLKKLEKIKIWGGEFKINELPDIFNGLPALREFCLVGNFIKTLPSSIYKLKKLEQLTIVGAGIAEIDKKIAGLKNLRELTLQDNMLNKLPDSLYSLPNLAELNIQDNNFSKKEIAYIKKHFKPNKKVKLHTNGQEKTQYVKKLRSCDFDKLEVNDYLKICRLAVKEGAYALKYVDKRIIGNDYQQLCEEAIFLYGSEFECVDPEQLGEGSESRADYIRKASYFELCKKAIQSVRYVEDVLRVTQDKYLDDEKYIQICLLAVLLHSGSWTVLQKINHKRLNRADYEMICRASIFTNPRTVGGMVDPTPELCLLAIKLGAHLGCIPKEMITREISLICVKRGEYYMIDDVPEEFRTAEFWFAAVEGSKHALKYVPDEFKVEVEALMKKEKKMKPEKDDFLTDDIPF